MQLVKRFLSKNVYWNLLSFFILLLFNSIYNEFASGVGQINLNQNIFENKTYL